jgi:hypothetical protein
MTSPLLALFIRSLREDARLKLTHAARAGLVVVVVLRAPAPRRLGFAARLA